ncbi:hypothetical protein FBU59_004485 [Linderina macrospora]|uniref:Uncharacterized protein n=1 Tax=Linderina macrospora TaxID=4868 RepID=A0ACC1J5A4_9FUNG|nr:hypothetical protein FBU59_004485 [Linderina macrospora]
MFGEQDFNHPFFITYLNTGTFSFYLVGAFLSRRRSHNSIAQRKRSASEESISSHISEEGSPLVSDEHAAAAASSHADPISARLTVRETVHLGVSFCMLWFAANITQNASLAYTTVANSSILCATSGLFTLAIGAMAGVENFNAMRLGAVLVSIMGVYSIIRFGADPAGVQAMPMSWFGDLLALSSAFLYGCYTTLLKLKIGDESRLDSSLFFGTVGLANILLLWPGFFLLHWLGIEAFALPGSLRLWLMILVNALIGTFLSDYLWLMAVLMTSPLVVTLGLSLTIPLSMAGDILWKGVSVGLPYYVGAVMILAAFIAANL